MWVAIHDHGIDLCSAIAMSEAVLYNDRGDFRRKCVVNTPSSWHHECVKRNFHNFTFPPKNLKMSFLCGTSVSEFYRPDKHRDKQMHAPKHTGWKHLNIAIMGGGHNGRIYAYMALDLDESILARKNENVVLSNAVVDVLIFFVLMILLSKNISSGSGISQELVYRLLNVHFIEGLVYMGI